MGIVIDEELAKRSVCTCHKIGPTDKPEDVMCFSPGVIGTLSNVQDIQLCKSRIVIEEDGIKRRTQEFRRASQKCKLETFHLAGGERIVKRIECMRRELKK